MNTARAGTSVQIATVLAADITALCDAAGASRMERIAALNIAKELVFINDAPIDLDRVAPEAPEESGRVPEPCQ